MERTAIVFGDGITPEAIAAYLPSNYRVADADITGRDGDSVVVAGHDVAGWTLDDYVIPHLASGLWWATEITTEETSLPVVAVTPSSGWPETDLIYRGHTYRYQGNLTWKKERTTS